MFPSLLPSMVIMYFYYTYDSVCDFVANQPSQSKVFMGLRFMSQIRKRRFQDSIIAILGMRMILFEGQHGAIMLTLNILEKSVAHQPHHQFICTSNADLMHSIIASTLKFVSEQLKLNAEVKS